MPNTSLGQLSKILEKDHYAIVMHDSNKRDGIDLSLSSLPPFLVSLPAPHTTPFPLSLYTPSPLLAVLICSPSFPLSLPLLSPSLLSLPPSPLSSPSSISPPLSSLRFSSPLPAARGENISTVGGVVTSIDLLQYISSQQQQ